MRIIEDGHVYVADHLDGAGATRIDFVNREPGREHEGTINQEILRILIDRVDYLDKKKPWRGNAEIIYHLRMALALHESRVIERKTETGKIEPEHVGTGSDGHFFLGH